MTVSFRDFGSLRGTERSAMVGVILCIAGCVAAHGQSDSLAEPEAATTTTSQAEFQYSTLTGSGATVTASRVPVVTGASVVYKDITLQFNIDASGNPTLATGYPKVVTSPNLIVSAFKSGKYVGPSTVLGGQAIITVSGPGIAAGGATEWSVSAATGANGQTYPSSATWYVGPIATSPLAARLKSAGITSTAWSYGVGSAQYSINGGTWNVDSLIGVSQVGNTLVFVSFTTNYKDSALPVDQITYTRVP